MQRSRALGPGGRSFAAMSSTTSILAGLGWLLIPKCPLCFLAYGAALGAAGSSLATHWWLTDAALVLLACVSVAVTFKMSFTRRDWRTIGLTAAAFLLFGVAGTLRDLRSPSGGLGALLLVFASLLNAKSCAARRAASSDAPLAKRAC